MTSLMVRQVELGPMYNFAYLIGDSKTREGMVVDPAWDVPAILKVAGEMDLKIVGALITHTHGDHVNGLKELVEATDCKVYVHRQEQGRLPDLKGNILRTEGAFTAALGGLSIEFIHTPGHTPGSQCFKVQDRLVSGDTLFIDHCGRCDLPESNPQAMWKSLHDVLMKLPDETVVLPGHNYAERADITTATLGDEKKHNQYLLCQDLDEFLAKRMKR